MEPTSDEGMPPRSPVLLPSAVDDHMAMRVQFTPMLLASKLRAAQDNPLSFRRPSMELIPPPSGAESPSASSPVQGSPPGGGGGLSPPSVSLRERSHHARPTLIISPDADRRASTRSGFANHGRSLRAPPFAELTLGEDSDRGDSFSQRHVGGRGDLAVAIPPRPLSRPPSGGPAILITSRPPSSQASSRPCSAASSCGTSRPSSASNLLRGCQTPGSTRPVSQRRMIAEYDHKLSCVLPGELFLGAEHGARDEAKLQMEGVTAIINCAALSCPNHYPERFNYLTLTLQDTVRAPSAVTSAHAPYPRAPMLLGGLKLTRPLPAASTRVVAVARGLVRTSPPPLTTAARLD